MRNPLTRSNPTTFSPSSLFDEFFNRTLENQKNWDSRNSWNRGSDIIEYEDYYELKIDMPGMEKDDISIELENNVLRVYGTRSETYGNEEEDGSYLHHGRRKSSFSQQIKLDNTINNEKISATFENGVLNVNLPKREELNETNSKKIEIN